MNNCDNPTSAVPHDVPSVRVAYLGAMAWTVVQHTMSQKINLTLWRQRATTSVDRHGRGSYSHRDVLALVEAVTAAQAYLDAADQHPDLAVLFQNWLDAQARFDFKDSP